LARELAPGRLDHRLEVSEVGRVDGHLGGDHDQWDPSDGRGGFRTCDLSRVKHGARGLPASKYLQIRLIGRAAKYWRWASYGPVRLGLAQRMAQRSDTIPSGPDTVRGVGSRTPSRA
jgi:hypothetical protein